MTLHSTRRAPVVSAELGPVLWLHCGWVYTLALRGELMARSCMRPQCMLAATILHPHGAGALVGLRQPAMCRTQHMRE